MHRIVLALFVLTAFAAPAQAAEIHVTTWAEPEVLVHPYELARNEDGSYDRNEDGSYRLAPVTFTVHYEATIDCIAGWSPDPDEVPVTSGGRQAIEKRNATTKEVTATYFAIDPHAVMVPWQGDATTGDWSVEGSFEVEVVSDARPPQTFEKTISWTVDVDHLTNLLTVQCEPNPDEGYTVRYDNKNHTIILPGIDVDPDSIDVPQDEKGTPGPSIMAMLAVLGVAGAIRRSH